MRHNLLRRKHATPSLVDVNVTIKADWDNVMTMESAPVHFACIEPVKGCVIDNNQASLDSVMIKLVDV